MSSSLKETKTKRPGGRAEEIRQAVTAAVLDVIQTGNVDFSYQEVAEQSGVNKTTLYRRWPNRNDLLREALKEHNATFKLPEPRSWSVDVKVLILEMAKFLSQPIEIAMNLALMNNPNSETNLLMVDQWTPVQIQVNQLVEHAQLKGELSKEIKASTVTLTLLSPLLVLTLLSRKRVDKKTINELVKLGQQLAIAN